MKVGSFLIPIDLSKEEFEFEMDWLSRMTKKSTILIKPAFLPRNVREYLLIAILRSKLMSCPLSALSVDAR